MDSEIAARLVAASEIDWMSVPEKVPEADPVPCWVWSQSQGTIGRVEVLGHGYSGRGEHRNCPASQRVKGEGPLPRGWYTIQAPVKHPRLGPYALRLDPDSENEMFGRGDFWIHGDNAEGDASHGCIILPYTIRCIVWMSGLDRLKVTT